MRMMTAMMMLLPNNCLLSQWSIAIYANTVGKEKREEEDTVKQNAVMI